MILLSIMLLSLSVIYFTRLFSKKNMRIASVAVAILYTNIIVWIYAIFVLDVANLGFSDTETRLSLLHGSDVYHSFVSITERMSVIPYELLKAIVAVATIVLIAGFFVAFHGFFEIAKAVVKAAKEKELYASSNENNGILFRSFIPFRANKIIRIYCRMNC